MGHKFADVLFLYLRTCKLVQGLEIIFEYSWYFGTHVDYFGFKKILEKCFC